MHLSAMPTAGQLGWIEQQSLRQGYFQEIVRNPYRRRKNLAFPRTGAMRITGQWPGPRENGRTGLTLWWWSRPTSPIMKSAGPFWRRESTWPATTTYGQAKELEALAEEKGLLFMVTYTYMGHVTAKYARELVASGAIGEVRTVMAEYPQGWLAFEDDFGGKQGEWRCDPQQSGGVNCLGDLGTHVENAVAAMTGLKIKRLLAKMDVIVPGRVLDDNDSILVEYDNGATGIYWTSQVAVGHDNSLRIRIYGSRGTIQWFQETPERITVIDADGTIREIHRGYGAIGEKAGKYGRLPAGHPEGWIEAMGNLYRGFAECIRAKQEGTFDPGMADYPTVSQGVEGLAFVEACLESNKNGNTWVELERR